MGAESLVDKTVEAKAGRVLGRKPAAPGARLAVGREASGKI